MGRYVERAENTARLLDVTYHGHLEPQSGEVFGATNTWQALTATLGLDTFYAAQNDTFNEAGVIAFLTVGRDNSSSITMALLSARENARSVRDYISSETWIAINRLYHATAGRNLHLIMADGLYDFCDAIRQGAQLFHGTAESTSLHDEGWYWLRTGVQLERADMITRIVDSKYHLLMSSLDEVGGAVDRYQWNAVLRSVSGYEAFQRTHAEGVDGPAVAEFLLLDARFPRSLRASVDGLLEALSHATEGAQPRLRNPSMRLVTQLQQRLQFETAETLLTAGLHEWVASAQDTLAQATSALSEAFFWSGPRAA
jgi:uncharacterized alpha-E superfamily protein